MSYLFVFSAFSAHPVKATNNPAGGRGMGAAAPGHG
jgi:hypothetical protein